jgi:hypothetical protein
MSLSDAFRDRHYAAGYIYIAGSLEGRVLKIGTTINIGQQQRKLQWLKYGGFGDWRLLYYVRVPEDSGRIEHSARARLQRYKTMRMYYKDGSRQKAREIVCCPFSTAESALSTLIDDDTKGKAWRSVYCDRYEF